jgi:hypothetical protein
MIPIVAGLAAVGPVANLFSNITQAVSKPNPAAFQQSMQSNPLVQADQIKINSLLQGRSPSQLSLEEQQKLSQLLVGKTIQAIDTQGQSIQGYIAQSSIAGPSSLLNIGGQNININQLNSIQLIA